MSVSYFNQKGFFISRTAWLIISLIIFSWILRSLPWEVFPGYSQDRQAFYLLDIRYNYSWVLPHNPEPWVSATKPPLFAWISTVLSYMLGVNAFPLRLPSLLASIGCLILVYLFTKKYFSEKAALFAIIVFGINSLFIRISTLIRTDALLTFLVVLYSLLIINAVHERRKLSGKENVILWSAISLLFLLKGPAFLPFFVALLIFPLFFKVNLVKHVDFRWFWIPLVIYGSWVYAAWMTGGEDFFNVAIQNDIIERILPDEERRKQSVYFYPMYMTTKLMPWFLIFLAFLFSRKRWKELMDNPILAMLFCWGVGSILIMSFIPSKRMDRMIASWPAFAILLGIYLADDNNSIVSRFSRLFFTVFGWIGAVGSVAIFLSILSDGDLRLPSLNIKEALDILPSSLYIMSISAFLFAIIFMIGYLTKRFRANTPSFCGLALFLFFSLYSIQRVTEPTNLIETEYHNFGRNVQQHVREINFDGKVILGTADRQMFWYSRVTEPKMGKDMLSADHNIAYISYLNEAGYLAEKGFTPVMTSKSLPGFKQYKVFALYLPAPNAAISSPSSE